MTDHRITPPPDELVDQWRNDNLVPENLANYVATQAARWGADQELEACVKWLKEQRWEALAIHLRSARCPKPPSLKEQALLAIDTAVADGRLSPDVSNVVRRALEQLDD